MSHPATATGFQFLEKLFIGLLIGPLFGLGVSNSISSVWAAEEKAAASDKVEAVADQLEYTRDNKKVIGRGNVVVTYGEVKLSSDYAEVETETKRAYARGHVILLRGDQVAAKGEEVYYDFEHDTGEFPNGQVVAWPWFASGKKIEQIGKGKIKVEDGTVTTCDLERAHYEIRAKHVTIHSGDKMFARDVSLHVLGKKVFWWPYAVIPLQETLESPIQIQPGYSSQDGAYVLTAKGFSLAKSFGASGMPTGVPSGDSEGGWIWATISNG